MYVAQSRSVVQDMSQASASAFDRSIMERCIQLSEEAVNLGEYPFSAIICREEKVVIEAVNRVKRHKDIVCHAELVALSEAQKALSSLDDCTIYSNVEPCAMCAFAIRETRIRRVVFSFKSPLMGGLSKWSILSDDDLARRMPEMFGSPPEVVAGLLSDEAARVWRRWNPAAWAVIKSSGVFSAS